MDALPTLVPGFEVLEDGTRVLDCVRDPARAVSENPFVARLMFVDRPRAMSSRLHRPTGDMFLLDEKRQVVYRMMPSDMRMVLSHGYVRFDGEAHRNYIRGTFELVKRSGAVGIRLIAHEEG